MNSSEAAGIAPDFSRRETERTSAFSKVWKNKLDAVFSDVAPYYDFASNVASLGLCARWRQRFVSAVGVRPGDRVLDVCAGTNAVGIGLLRRQPQAHVFAIDRSKAMQEVGRGLARANGFEIESVIGDAHHLPYPDDFFDVVTLQWASRHLRIVEVFSEVRRVLKPGGHFHHCDMLRPRSRPVQAAYSAYLKACVSMTALAFGSGPEAWSCRDYFVRAIEMFYSAEEISELLSQVGFDGITAQVEAGGILAYHRAAAR